MPKPIALAVRVLLRSNRTTLGLLLVAGYLLAALGHPTWKPVVAKRGGESFACQHRACGCMSAEQCRTNCCCRPKVKPKTCCAVKEETHQASSPAPAESRPGWIVGFMARECQGSSVDWIQSGWVALVPPSPIEAPLTPPAAPKFFAETRGYLPPDLGRIDRPG